MQNHAQLKHSTLTGNQINYKLIWSDLFSLTKVQNKKHDTNPEMSELFLVLLFSMMYIQEKRQIWKN